MAAPTKTLGPFTAGMDNRARDFALPSNAMRDAVNVDLSNTGHPRRREGVTPLIESVRTHSLWAPEQGRTGYYLADGTLHSFTPSGVSIALLSGLSPLRRGWFAEIPGRGIGFTNGQVIKRITSEGIKPFAISASRDLPLVVPGSGGALLAGLYEVCVSHVDAAGEESGVVVSDRVEVLDNGKITVLLPQSPDPAAIATRVYVSARNSEHSYLAAQLPIDATQYEVVVASDDGRRVSTMYLLPLPAGDLIAFYHGRTYTHANGILSFTEPWSGLYQPLRNFVPFPADVSIVAPMPDGLFIVADKTYFLAGDATIDSGLREIADTTAVRGTLVRMPNSNNVMWFTPRGLVLAGPGGSLSFVQEKTVAVQPATEGAALYRESDGLHQVITSVRDPGESVAGARSWFTVKLGSRETRNEF